MIYLISKVVFWMALAFILGALLGWWLRRIKANEAQAAYTAELATLAEQNDSLAGSNATLTQDLDYKVQALSSVEDTLSAKEQELLTQTNELLKLQRRLSESQERIAEQEEETTQLSGQLELQRSSFAELQLKADTLSTDYQQAQSQWTLERSALEDKLAIADKDLAAITASASKQQQQLIDERERVTAEHAVAHSALQTQLDQAQAGADQGVKKLQAKVDGLQQQHQILQQQHTEQLELAQSLDKSNHRLSTKVANLLEELGSEKSSAEQRHGDLQAQVEQLQQTLTEAQALAEERQRELDANNESLSSNESQVQRLTQDVRRWRQRIPDLQGELDEKDALLRERNARLATLQEQLQDRKVRLQASQQALIATRNNALPQQQKDARIAALMAQVESMRRTTPVAEVPLSIPTVEPAASDSPSRPQNFFATRPSRIDDLQRIKGIGPKLEELLHELGIYQYQQIAELSRSDVSWLDDYLNFKGRIDRDNWIAQAGEFARSG